MEARLDHWTASPGLTILSDPSDGWLERSDQWTGGSGQLFVTFLYPAAGCFLVVIGWSSCGHQVYAIY